MKKTAISVLSCVALSATTFAGTSVVSSKEMKQPVAPATCFNDTELQADVFGAYAITKGGQGGALNGDHGWGGGVGVNYFFQRYIGVGVEGYWLDSTTGPGRWKTDRTASGTFVDQNGKTRQVTGSISSWENGAGGALQAVAGSLLLRLPMDQYCLAPYIFAGGGGNFDGTNSGSAHWGGGLEYRAIPHKLGIFTDARFVWEKTQSDGVGNPHYTLVRLGVRWVF